PVSGSQFDPATLSPRTHNGGLARPLFSADVTCQTKISFDKFLLVPPSCECREPPQPRWRHAEGALSAMDISGTYPTSNQSSSASAGAPRTASRACTRTSLW